VISAYAYRFELTISYGPNYCVPGWYLWCSNDQLNEWCGWNDIISHRDSPYYNYISVLTNAVPASWKKNVYMQLVHHWTHFQQR